MNFILCWMVLGIMVRISEPRPSTLEVIEAKMLQILEERADDEDATRKSCPPIMDRDDLAVESENAPTAIEINECQMKEFNPTAICDEFDVTMCGDSCAVGFETDENGCVMSCACKNEGIMEGDIMMSLSEASAFLDDSDRAASRYKLRWNKMPVMENGKKVYLVPFVFGPGVDHHPRAMAAILDATHQFRQKTCIRFQRRQNEEDYLEFFAGTGCWSKVGRKKGKQQISIGRGCEGKGIVMHEMMHAMGFLHEQSRPDRDKFVEIVEENIKPGFGRNFEKHNKLHINSMSSPYDIGSLMHYDGHSFSKNGKPTILDRETGQPVKAQENGFSSEDIKQLNKMYKCTDYYEE